MKRTMRLMLLLVVGFGVAAPTAASSRHTADAPGMFAIGDQVFEGEQIQLEQYPASFVALNVDGRRIAMLSLDPCSSSSGALTLGFSRDRTGLYRLTAVRRGPDRCDRHARRAPLVIASLEDGMMTVAQYTASKRDPIFTLTEVRKQDQQETP